MYMYTHQVKAAMSKVRQEIEAGYGGPISDELLSEESPRERAKRGFTAQSPPSLSSSGGGGGLDNLPFRDNNNNNNNNASIALTPIEIG